LDSENAEPKDGEPKYQCPYCPLWDQDSTPVIAHIMRLHPGERIPPISELVVSDEED
jgi:hypothetical protein